MQAAINLRCKETDYAVVEELILDTCKIPYLSEEDGALLSQFHSLEDLGMNGVGLTSLKNFPVLPKLRSVELQDNHLTDECDVTSLARTETLKEVLLGGNKIKSLESLQPLVDLKSLRALDLDLNPVCKIIALETLPDGSKEDQGAMYRQAVFQMFPQVETVDSYDRSGNEVYDDEDEDEEEDDAEADASGMNLADFYNAEFTEADDEKEAHEVGKEYKPEEEAEEDEEEESDEDSAVNDVEDTEWGILDAMASAAERPKRSMEEEAADESERKTQRMQTDASE